MNKIITMLILMLASAAFADHENGHVDVEVGELTPRATVGQLKFNEICAACHGFNGQGSKIGPPLIHNIYNPGHHGNNAFSQAVLKGVQQHHWSYGNMPPQRQVGFSDMANIMAFIREVQVQNEIYIQEHKM